GRENVVAWGTRGPNSRAARCCTDGQAVQLDADRRVGSAVAPVPRARDLRQSYGAYDPRWRDGRRGRVVHAGPEGCVAVDESRRLAISEGPAALHGSSRAGGRDRSPRTHAHGPLEAAGFHSVIGDGEPLWLRRLRGLQDP